MGSPIKQQMEQTVKNLFGFGRKPETERRSSTSMVQSSSSPLTLNKNSSFRARATSFFGLRKTDQAEKDIAANVKKITNNLNEYKRLESKLENINNTIASTQNAEKLRKLQSEKQLLKVCMDSLLSYNQEINNAIKYSKLNRQDSQLSEMTQKRDSLKKQLDIEKSNFEHQKKNKGSYQYANTSSNFQSIVKDLQEIDKEIIKHLDSNSDSTNINKNKQLKSDILLDQAHSLLNRKQKTLDYIKQAEKTLAGLEKELSSLKDIKGSIKNGELQFVNETVLNNRISDLQEISKVIRSEMQFASDELSNIADDHKKHQENIDQLHENKEENSQDRENSFSSDKSQNDIQSYNNNEIENNDNDNADLEDELKSLNENIDTENLNNDDEDIWVEISEETENDLDNVDSHSITETIDDHSSDHKNSSNIVKNNFSNELSEAQKYNEKFNNKLARLNNYNASMSTPNLLSEINNTNPYMSSLPRSERATTITEQSAVKKVNSEYHKLTKMFIKNLGETTYNQKLRAFIDTYQSLNHSNSKNLVGTAQQLLLSSELSTIQKIRTTLKPQQNKVKQNFLNNAQTKELNTIISRRSHPTNDASVRQAQNVLDINTKNLNRHQ